MPKPKNKPKLSEDNQKLGLLTKAKKEAMFYGVKIARCEAMFREIEESYYFSISPKYQAIFYFAATANYSAEDLAQMFAHSRKNINSDFSKNLGEYLKSHFDLDDQERIGITSLRRFLFKKGFLININDNNLSINILDHRLDENTQLETSLPKETSTN